MTRPDRLVLATAARDALGREHAIDAAVQRRLGSKYRPHAREIEAVLQASLDDASQPYAPALAALDRPSRVLAPTLTTSAHASADSSDLASSYLHTPLDRMLASAPRDDA